MKKKRVAYIGIKALPATMGVDSVVEKIVDGIDPTRFQPVVYVRAQEVPESVELPGIELVRITTLPGKYLKATSLFLLSALHALFFGKYDLINVHSTETCFVLPILRLRYRVISTAHGLARMEPDDLTKWGRLKFMLVLPEIPLMYLSNIRTSVSKPDKDFLESRYHKPVVYLPNGVEERTPDIEAANELLSRYGLEPGKYIIFTAGRIVPRKGCHFVLEAMQQMGDDVKLLVVGGADHVPEYAAKLHELADDRVHFCGFVSSKELLFGLIQQSQIFVFPTTYEAMAMTLLEVASLGTPLVASDIPENREVLPEQALFFKSGDVADLRNKMEWALANPGQMGLMAGKARKWVAANYMWPGIISEYEHLYDELTGNPPVAVTERQEFLGNSSNL
ncbi:MAG: glycosyltransferase family 4 protein [Chloroflexota bacterium]